MFKSIEVYHELSRVKVSNDPPSVIFDRCLVVKTEILNPRAAWHFDATNAAKADGKTGRSAKRLKRRLNRLHGRLAGLGGWTRCKSTRKEGAQPSSTSSNHKWLTPYQMFPQIRTKHHVVGGCARSRPFLPAVKH